MGDENVSPDSLLDSAFKPRDRKRPFNSPNFHEDTLAAAFDASVSAQDTFQTKNGGNSSGSLSDTAFKPRERKRLFEKPNYHENTLALDFSNVPSSDQDSVVLPIRPRNLLKEKNCNLTFTASQSQENSRYHGPKERMQPNFDADQSFNETFNQSVRSFSKSTKQPYRFHAPPDLTFGGISSVEEATSQESSCVSSGNRSTTLTNSNFESSSLSSTEPIESSSNFCADQSASEKSDDDESPKVDVTLTDPSSSGRSNASTNVSKLSEIPENYIETKDDSKYGSHNHNLTYTISVARESSTVAQLVVPEQVTDLSSTKNDANPATENIEDITLPSQSTEPIESSSNFCADQSASEKSDDDESPKVDVTLTDPSSSGRSNASTNVSKLSEIPENDIETKDDSKYGALSVSERSVTGEIDLSSTSRTVSFVHDISKISESHNHNLTYTISVARESSTVAQLVVPEQVTDLSSTKNDANPATENIEDITLPSQSNEPEAKADSTFSVLNVESVTTVEPSQDFYLGLESDLHLTHGSIRNISRVSNDLDVCESQESVVLLKSADRPKKLDSLKIPNRHVDFNAHSVSQITEADEENVFVSQESVFLGKPEERLGPLDLLKERSCVIDFDATSSQTTVSQAIGEIAIVSQESVVFANNDRKKRALDLLRDKRCSVNFSLNQSQSVTLSETVFDSRKRFQFDAAGADDLTFSMPTSQQSVDNVSSATYGNLSVLIEEESLIGLSRQNTDATTTSMTFEIIEPSQAESEKISEIEMSKFSLCTETESDVSGSIHSQSEVGLKELENTLKPEEDVIDRMQISCNVSENKTIEENVVDISIPQSNTSKHESSVPLNDAEVEGDVIDLMHPESNIQTLSESLAKKESEELRCDTRTTVNTSNAEHLSRLIVSETDAESFKSAMQETEIQDGTCNVMNTDDLSYSVMSEIKKMDSFNELMSRKFDNTYTIVNRTNIGDATHVTGKFESLVNVSNFGQAESNVTDADAETTLVPTPENDMSVEKREKLNDAESLNKTLTFRDVAESQQATKSLLIENVNVTAKDVAESIDIESTRLPARAALIGHSYSAPPRPSETETEFQKESQAILEIPGVESTATSANRSASTESLVPKRRSSRLQAKKSTEVERTLTNNVPPKNEVSTVSCENVSPNQSASTSRKRKVSLHENRSSQSVDEELASREASPAQPETLTVHLNTESNQWESGVNMLSEERETKQLSVLDNDSPGLSSSGSNNANDVEGRLPAPTDVFQETPVIPARKARRLSKKESLQNNTKRSSSPVPSIVVSPTNTPVVSTRRSERLSKRKSPDYDSDTNGVSFAPEPDSAMKDLGALRKSTRLSTKAVHTVRFVDTFHSFSTIDGAAAPNISITGKLSVPPCRSSSTFTTRSSTTSGEPSLVNKLFAKKDEKDNEFVQPTSTAPKTKKKKKKADRSDRLLTFSEDEEMKVLPKKPNFPRLADYIHKGFYKVLADKMRPRYGIQTNAKVVAFARVIKSDIDKIRLSEERYPEEEVIKFKRMLARQGIVETNWDFWRFSHERFPRDFHLKAFPLFVFKDGKRQLRDESRCFERILSDEEDDAEK